MSRSTWALALTLVATASLLSTATAAGLLFVPLANGRFEAGAQGWTLGEGVSIGDGDYDGDLDAVLKGNSSGVRLVTQFPQAPVPATYSLSFQVDRGTADGVRVFVTLLDVASLPDTQFEPPTLSWSIDAVSKGRLVLDPAAAESTLPGWAEMTEDERRAALGNHLYASLGLSVQSAHHPFGTLFDNFSFVV